MKYGKVIFSEGGIHGADLQRKLVERLTQHNVISVPEEKIQKWYDHDRMDPCGCVHSYVLHDEEEADIFRTVMESEEMRDDSVKWMITRFNHDRGFRKWVKDVEKHRREDAKRAP